MPQMSRILTRIGRWSAAALLLAGPATAAAAVIDFDDIDTSPGLVNLATMNPYQGYTWTRFNAYTTFIFTGFNNGIVSPANAAFSGGEFFDGSGVQRIVGRIESPGRFTLVSADLGAGWYDNLHVTVEGLRGGSAVFSETVTVDTRGAQTFGFNFTDVDALALYATRLSESTDPYGCGPFNCTQFTVDDIVIAAVPEPDGVALLAAGVAAAAVTRRGRRRRT